MEKIKHNSDIIIITKKREKKKIKKNNDMNTTKMTILNQYKKRTLLYDIYNIYNVYLLFIDLLFMSISKYSFF